MADNRYEDDSERPTNRGRKPPSDPNYTLGQLMVESLNHRRRIEVVELRLTNLESSKKDSQPPEGSSIYPGGRTRLFALVKKTFTYTVICIAAILSTLRELGYLK